MSDIVTIKTSVRGISEVITCEDILQLWQYHKTFELLNSKEDVA